MPAKKKEPAAKAAPKAEPKEVEPKAPTAREVIDGLYAVEPAVHAAALEVDTDQVRYQLMVVDSAIKSVREAERMNASLERP
jgi:hypothetical protein